MSSRLELNRKGAGWLLPPRLARNAGGSVWSCRARARHSKAPCTGRRRHPAACCPPPPGVSIATFPRNFQGSHIPSQEPSEGTKCRVYEEVAKQGLKTQSRGRWVGSEGRPALGGSGAPDRSPTGEFATGGSPVAPEHLRDLEGGHEDERRERRRLLV